MINSLAEFMAAGALRTGEADLGGGITVRVRELSVAARTEYQNAIKAGGDAAAVVLLRHCVIDSEGKPMFSEQTAKEALALRADIADLITIGVSKIGQEEGEKKA